VSGVHEYEWKEREGCAAFLSCLQFRLKDYKQLEVDDRMILAAA
jgi:hypothetical protein